MSLFRGLCSWIEPSPRWLKSITLTNPAPTTVIARWRCGWAEEVDLLNQILEEQDRQSRERDRGRGSTGLSPEEARELVKLGAELSRSAPDSFGVEHMGGDDADSSSAERSAARASRSGSPSVFHSMTPQKTEPEPALGGDPFEQARGQERESVARLTSGELEESTRPESTRP